MAEDGIERLARDLRFNSQINDHDSSVIVVTGHNRSQLLWCPIWCPLLICGTLPAKQLFLKSALRHRSTNRDSKLVHTIVVTVAHVADITEAAHPLYGHEKQVTPTPATPG